MLIHLPSAGVRCFYENDEFAARIFSRLRIDHSMKLDYLFNILAGVGVLIGITRLTQSCSNAPATLSPVEATAGKDSLAERGRYLVRISGCNDCHTPRFPELGEKVPESEWLTGVPVGWRGPWAPPMPAICGVTSRAIPMPPPGLPW